MIVSCGEALVDLLPRPEGQGGGFTAKVGGGPFNVARTIGRLGHPAGYLGRLGDDAFGALLRAQLAADAVDLSYAVACADPTTLALAELDGAGSATYRFYAAATSAPGLTADALPALRDDVRAVVIGSLGLVLEPLATALETLAQREAGRRFVAVDPNVRPAAIPDEAAYRGRLDRVLAVADLVKVSDADLAWLEPDAAPVEAAAALQQRAPHALVVVTEGADGAFALDAAGAAVRVPAPSVAVVDTVGAGDSFLGGLLAFLAERDALVARSGRSGPSVAGPSVAGPVLREALAFAASVAARTCARAGAEPPWRAELDAAGTLVHGR